MKKTEEFWNKQAKTYDKSGKGFEYAFIKILKNTKKYLKSTDIVLDYGCATGKRAFDLAPYVKKIHGSDISSKMIEEAKRKTEESESI